MLRDSNVEDTEPTIEKLVNKSSYDEKKLQINNFLDDYYMENKKSKNSGNH
jgi:hypothetical protein